MRKTPVVLGVLSIIFGSVTAVLSLLTVMMGPLFSKLSQLTANLPGRTELLRAQMEAADALFAEMAGYMKLSAALYLIMSVALVVVGVGLYRRRAWARRATMAWSIAGVVMNVANFIFSVAWMQPHQRAVQRAIFAAHGLTQRFELGAASQTALMLFSTLMYCAFPAVLLALIGRRSAARDFLPPTSSTTTSTS